MFAILRIHLPSGTKDYFGPFPTEERAKKYSDDFEIEQYAWSIVPLIVPNCVTVKLNY
jgi:hypothetical protein